MALTCHLPGCDGATYPGTTIHDWSRHEATFHATSIDQLPTVDWHARAITEVKRLAASGQEFAFWQIAQAVGDPDGHQNRMGAFAAEVEHLGLAHVARYGKSLRPGTKGSACAYWRGGRKPAQENAA